MITLTGQYPTGRASVFSELKKLIDSGTSENLKRADIIQNAIMHNISNQNTDLISDILAFDGLPDSIYLKTIQALPSNLAHGKFYREVFNLLSNPRIGQDVLLAGIKFCGVGSLRVLELKTKGIPENGDVDRALNDALYSRLRKAGRGELVWLHDNRKLVSGATSGRVLLRLNEKLLRAVDRAESRRHRDLAFLLEFWHVHLLPFSELRVFSTKVEGSFDRALSEASEKGEVKQFICMMAKAMELETGGAVPTGINFIDRYGGYFSNAMKKAARLTNFGSIAEVFHGNSHYEEFRKQALLLLAKNGAFDEIRGQATGTHQKPWTQIIQAYYDLEPGVVGPIFIHGMERCVAMGQPESLETFISPYASFWGKNDLAVYAIRRLGESARPELVGRLDLSEFGLTELKEAVNVLRVHYLFSELLELHWHISPGQRFARAISGEELPAFFACINDGIVEAIRGCTEAGKIDALIRARNHRTELFASILAEHPEFQSIYAEADAIMEQRRVQTEQRQRPIQEKRLEAFSAGKPLSAAYEHPFWKRGPIRRVLSAGVEKLKKTA
jgi:hypothetical protein